LPSYAITASAKSPPASSYDISASTAGRLTSTLVAEIKALSALLMVNAS